MKKFFSILFCIIVAMVAMSCGSKVEKDIKAQLAVDGGKLLSVKSVDIAEDFYLYTNEYSNALENYKIANKQVFDMIPLVAKAKVYKYNCYDDFKSQLDSYEGKASKYLEDMRSFEENLKSGKVYIAKFKGKNPLTGKYLDFNSYQIFSYNSDGTIHQVEADNDIQLICSVYPKASRT